MPSLCLEDDIANVYCRKSCSRCDTPTPAPTPAPTVGPTPAHCEGEWEDCGGALLICVEKDISDIYTVGEAVDGVILLLISRESWDQCAGD